VSGDVIDGREGEAVAKAIAALLLAAGAVVDVCERRWIVTDQLTTAAAALADRLEDIR
jgi:hypothetical protein